MHDQHSNQISVELELKGQKSKDKPCSNSIRMTPNIYSTLVMDYKVSQQWHSGRRLPCSFILAGDWSCSHVPFAGLIDVYLPVCACCTGCRIFCTASVDRRTHCKSFSQSAAAAAAVGSCLLFSASIGGINESDSPRCGHSFVTY